MVAQHIFTFISQMLTECIKQSRSMGWACFALVIFAKWVSSGAFAGCEFEVPAPPFQSSRYRMFCRN